MAPFLCQDTWFERWESSPKSLSSCTHTGGNSIYRICQLPFLFTQVISGCPQAAEWSGIGVPPPTPQHLAWTEGRGQRGQVPLEGGTCQGPRFSPTPLPSTRGLVPVPHCGVLLSPTESGRAESRGSQAQGHGHLFSGILSAGLRKAALEVTSPGVPVATAGSQVLRSHKRRPLQRRSGGGHLWNAHRAQWGQVLQRVVQGPP